MSDSSRPHNLQHTRPPCPSPTPRVHSNSCPSSRWYHPAISSSVIPFSSCSQSLPASESFPMSQLFAKYWSFSFSIIPSKEHPGLISFRMDWLDLLAVQGQEANIWFHGCMTLEPKKRKSVTASTFSPSICHEVMGPDVMILAFLILSFKPIFSLSVWGAGI